MKRLATIVILILTFCGLADSAYLTQHEMDGTPLLCNINNLSGCNIVAQSSYSHMFGLSLAEYGLIFYGVLFMVAALELLVVHRRARRIIQGIATLGFGASVYFTFLQIFVINALCIYCLASAFITVCIFLVASSLEPVRRRFYNHVVVVPEEPPPPPPPYFSMPPRG